MTDFDPLSEEGQEDINDQINDDYESLLQQGDEPPFRWWDRLSTRFGRGAKYAATRLRDLYRTRNPKSAIPEYLKLNNIEDIRTGIPQDLSQSWINAIELQHNESAESVAESVDQFKERFPTADLDIVDFVYALDDHSRDIILGKLKSVSRGTPTPYVLIDGEGRFNPRGNIPKTLLKALGEPNLRFQMEESERALSEASDTISAELSETGTAVNWAVAEEEIEERRREVGPDAAAALREQYEFIQRIVDEKDNYRIRALDLEQELGGIEAYYKQELANEKQRADTFEDKLETLKKSHQEEKDELQKKINDVSGDRDLVVEQIKTIDEKYIYEKEMLSKIHQQEMDAGRKKLLELEGDKRTKMGIIKELQGEIKDRDASYRRSMAQLQNDVHNLTQTDKVNQQAIENQLKKYDDLVKDRDRLFTKSRELEEKLRQDQQAADDYERHISILEERLKDATKTEEEKEAIRQELERLTKARDEALEDVQQVERELGLTMREKIKRALEKAGMGVMFAGAIAGIVSLILNLINGAKGGLKKLGKEVKDMGKKLAASVPGLLGTVLSLILKAGGELLKFLGNNIWILVVAVGAVVLKSLSEKRR